MVRRFGILGMRWLRLVLLFYRRRRLSILHAMRPAAPTDMAPNPLPF